MMGKRKDEKNLSIAIRKDEEKFNCWQNKNFRFMSYYVILDFQNFGTA